MDQPPPEPYVRHVGELPEDWHIAVRVLPEGSVIVRCRLVPLAVPLQWRRRAPEMSIDAAACPRCVSA
jgi:hypothetical protein